MRGRTLLIRAAPSHNGDDVDGDDEDGDDDVDSDDDERTDLPIRAGTTSKSSMLNAHFHTWTSSLVIELYIPFHLFVYLQYGAFQEKIRDTGNYHKVTNTNTKCLKDQTHAHI